MPRQRRLFVLGQIFDLKSQGTSGSDDGKAGMGVGDGGRSRTSNFL